MHDRRGHSGAHPSWFVQESPTLAHPSARIRTENARLARVPFTRRPAVSAELALVGGVIRTLDHECPRPEVVLVRDGRVVATGGRELLGGGPALDLQGATVVPGL